MTPILINDNLISTAAQRGIARYFGKIVDGAIEYLGEAAVICSPQKRNYGSTHHVRTIRFPGSWRIGLQDKFATVAAAITRPTVIYNVYYGHVKSKALQAYTVYDMMHEMFAPPGHPFIAQKRRCLERAAALLAISKHTAADIQKIYPDIDSQKIIITQLGVDSFFFDTQPSNSSGKRPYFLYVGHRTPYKNFMRLLTAYGQSGLVKEFDLQVISPSGAEFMPEEIDCIKKFGLAGHVHLVFSPPDAFLRASYAGAVAFIYPSIYEGFGLPILEALASGTLVVTSNISSMPELGGDVAFYFDPESAESIAAALQQITDLSSTDRAQRIKSGINRAATFTWERCIQKTMAALQNLAA